MSDDSLDPWRTFWLAGELSEATGPAFAARINDFEAADGSAGRRFTFAPRPHPLRRTRDPLARLLARRASERSFGVQRLSARQLSGLFAAFADPAPATPTRRRAWPSAGGLYPLEIFGVLLNVDHALDGTVVHYEPDEHGLTEVGLAPPWDTLRLHLGADAVSGTPHVVVLFVLDMERMEAKYGNRGGRFGLIEVGHAAQNLALRVASGGLAGCELGGGHDRRLLALLGLDPARARCALAYACGVPARRRSRWRR